MYIQHIIHIHFRICQAPCIIKLQKILKCSGYFLIKSIKHLYKKYFLLYNNWVKRNEGDSRLFWKAKRCGDGASPYLVKSYFRTSPLGGSAELTVSADVFFTLQKSLIHLLGTKWAYLCQIRWYRVYHVLNFFRTCFLLPWKAIIYNKNVLVNYYCCFKNL